MVVTKTSVKTVVLAFVMLLAEIVVLATMPTGENQLQPTFALSIFTIILMMIPTAFAPNPPENKGLLLEVEMTAKKGSRAFFISSMFWMILIGVGIWRAGSVREIPLIPLVYHTLGFVFTSWASWSYFQELILVRRSLREFEVSQIMDG